MAEELELLTVSSAARALRVSEATIKGYEKKGVLSASRTETGTRLFKRRDVEQLAAARQARRPV